MPVFIATADVVFINLDDPAKFLDVLDHCDSDLMAHEPSSFVAPEAHVTEDLKSAHASAAGYSSTGIGLGPTYMYAQGLLTFFPEPAAVLRSGGRCPVKLSPAFERAPRAILHASISGPSYS
jgi:hypothetical protein